MAVTPPRPKGPPMTSLRAFEAAARLGGFARAGDELCVTPGAVAQQVKALEDWCGAALFERRAQGVVLSAAGAQALPKLSAAFDGLGAAVTQLRQATAPGRLHIAALPAVAQLWLSPRMPAIRAALPDVEISVTALEQPPNMTREPFDLSVFYGTDQAGGQGAGQVSGQSSGQAIEQDVIFPVCAPEVARALHAVQDLASVPCLSDAVWSEDWAIWLGQAGSDLVPRGPIYSLYALAVQEAVNGAGVLIGHAALVRRHLAEGRLVRPFAQQAQLPRWLELGRKQGDAASPPLRALSQLLIAEGGL